MRAGDVGLQGKVATYDETHFDEQSNTYGKHRNKIFFKQTHLNLIV